uniref:DUF7032 domain-containing protein n=1 Tax=Kalanchoe fedtschenkoi TaxID=63787 RepID=A0A7N0RAI3_KALFE
MKSPPLSSPSPQSSPTSFPIPPSPHTAMKVSGSDPVDLAANFLSELTEEVVKVRSFKGKWSSVKSKLADLRTQLTDLTDFPNSASNPLFLELVQSVVGTLEEGLALARRCQREDFKAGKLRTQSDIDSMIARLDRHIRDGEILIKSGVLQDGGGGSSKREAVRADARNLVTRLQIGSVESKNAAMDSLLGLLIEDDKNVLIAVAQGVVPVLAKLLDSTSAEMKEKAVCAISRVSMVESSKHVLVAEGLMLLNHLIRVLESGSGFAKEKACIALQGLSTSKENARAIGSRGGISSLLEICQAGTPNSQAAAAGVLKNLAKFDEIKENFMEENALPVLLGLLACGTSSAQENAIGCLCNLVAGDEELKLRFAREGGFGGLKNFWDGAPAAQSLEVALDLFTTLASCAPIAEALAAEGFISRLVIVLNCEVSGVRIAAAKAVNELGLNSKTRKSLGDFGCIPLLVRMLENKAVEEKEAAAKALSNLVQCESNKKIFKKDERGIVNVVQLLDPSVQNLDKRYPVFILASLAHSKKCRKSMTAAGASPHLQKLVEMDVEGSKKLFESIRHGKVWGIFARS